ncbi:ATP-dependent DNA helicase [Trichonephila clavata]|uniref:ATP-dependent DNA helicase n=1 Tax=Trichonephila clavata TaxID=2740835 RepID=A0A8X6HUJ0_TRICU|nr:ATP-dependent DNA helicase [Trichonephila clavata]
MPEQHMTDNEFLSARRAMNVGQKDAFLFITRSISEQLNNQSDERLRLFITGNAGTGKTFLFNLLKNQDSLVDGTRKNDNIDLNNIVPSDINKTGGLPKKLEIFVGAKVMLRYNVDVSKDLVNGAIGHITEIIWPCFRKVQMYDTGISSVRIDFGKDGVHLIQPKTVQFPAKYSHGTAERRILPIIFCLACTVHKMQGSIVDHAAVYLGSKLFAAGQAYAALSRVKSLGGLLIEELDCSKLTGKRP